AVGKVRVAYYKRVAAPANVLLDASGEPTNDPAVMYEEPLGALLAAAGHKGYALGFVCDLLGAALFGGATAHPDNLRPGGMYNNMIAIVFDPARFGALDHYERETQAFLQYVRSARRAQADQPILIPGEPEERYRAARARALPLDAGTVALLDEAVKTINGLRGTSVPLASTLIVEAAS